MTSDRFIFGLDLLNPFYCSPNNSDIIYKNNHKACHVLSKVPDLFIVLKYILVTEHYNRFSPLIFKAIFRTSSVFEEK